MHFIIEMNECFHLCQFISAPNSNSLSINSQDIPQGAQNDSEGGKKEQLHNTRDWSVFLFSKLKVDVSFKSTWWKNEDIEKGEKKKKTTVTARWKDRAIIYTSSQLNMTACEEWRMSPRAQHHAAALDSPHHEMYFFDSFSWKKGNKLRVAYLRELTRR